MSTQPDLEAQHAHENALLDGLDSAARLQQRRRKPAHTMQDMLSHRERQCITLIALGRTDDEIARHLNISRSTVRFHFKNICKRLEAPSRTNAVFRACSLGIIPSMN